MKRILIVTATLVLTTTGVLAKDMMEKVDIALDGIDMQKVVVRSSGDSYKATITPSYKFYVRGFARAKKMYRIANAWFYSGTTGHPAHEWGLPGRDYGNGQKEMIKYSTAYEVPLKKMVWDGPNPVAACNANLAKLKAAGFSASEIINKKHQVGVKAIVGFGAAADKKGKQAVSLGKAGSTYKHKTLSYPVMVECRR